MSTADLNQQIDELARAAEDAAVTAAHHLYKGRAKIAKACRDGFHRENNRLAVLLRQRAAQRGVDQ